MSLTSPLEEATTAAERRWLRERGRRAVKRRKAAIVQHGRLRHGWKPKALRQRQAPLLPHWWVRLRKPAHHTLRCSHQKCKVGAELYTQVHM